MAEAPLGARNVSGTTPIPAVRLSKIRVRGPVEVGERDRGAGIS